MRKLIIPLCAAIIVACLTVPFILLAKKAKEEQQIAVVPANLPQPEVPSGYVPDSTQDVTAYVLVETAREVPVATALIKNGEVEVVDSGASVSFVSARSNPAVFVSEEHIRAMQKQRKSGQ